MAAPIGPRWFALLLSACVVTVACEVDTVVAIDGRNPPTFRLSGSGGINFFRVLEEPASGQSFMDAPVLWEITPTLELHGTSASKLPSITYGVVPSGFTQTKPESGPPRALTEGKVYDAWAPTYNANGGGVWFTIRGGESVEIKDR